MKHYEKSVLNHFKEKILLISSKNFSTIVLPGLSEEVHFYF